MTFDKLEKNLMDVIQEEQAKLGFRREKIRLYYPLTTLNHLLDTEDTAEQMEITLAGQPESMTRKLGNLDVTRRGDRFCLCIPEPPEKVTALWPRPMYPRPTSSSISSLRTICV